MLRKYYSGWQMCSQNLFVHWIEISCKKNFHQSYDSFLFGSIAPINVCDSDKSQRDAKISSVNNDMTMCERKNNLQL